MERADAPHTHTSRGLSKHVINDGEVAETDGDQKALALIGLSVMDHHLPSLGQWETAKAAWDALEAVYKRGSCYIICLRSALTYSDALLGL